jgi:hypothetical protein
LCDDIKAELRPEDEAECTLTVAKCNGEFQELTEAVTAEQNVFSKVGLVDGGRLVLKGLSGPKKSTRTWHIQVTYSCASLVSNGPSSENSQSQAPKKFQDMPLVTKCKSNKQFELQHDL